MLMDQEMQLFYDGMWTRAYEYFGAHAMEKDGKQGFFFRLWAPHARSVTLAGDWNGWKHDAMTCNGHGVWELFVPDARELDSYKYMVEGADGKKRWKTDPFCFHTQTRPETGRSAGALCEGTGLQLH